MFTLKVPQYMYKERRKFIELFNFNKLLIYILRLKSWANWQQNDRTNKQFADKTWIMCFIASCVRQKNVQWQLVSKMKIGGYLTGLGGKQI